MPSYGWIDIGSDPGIGVDQMRNFLEGSFLNTAISILAVLVLVFIVFAVAASLSTLLW